MNQPLSKWERFLRSFVPVKQDSLREWIRKILLIAAILLFIGAAYSLLDEQVIQPQIIKKTAEVTRELYDPEVSDVPEEEDYADVEIPAELDPSFARLYRRNKDIKGWLTFATTGDDLFDGAIDNPVVQTTNDKYYLSHNFFKEQDKSGTLFFDHRNDVSASSEDRNLMIYGHNLPSGLMFSKFNLLMNGDVNRGKRLTTMTLHMANGDKATYKVIAVLLTNVYSSEGPPFNFRRLDFSSDEDFLDYVAEIRRRSLYDYNDVDVQAGDTLLTLSACTNKRDAHFLNGRAVVIARRVREGEDPTVDASKTVKNEDVLMPRAWYTEQGKEVPEEYGK